MRDLVTLVVTIRNREASRIIALVNSIRRFGADPYIIIIDYGSTPSYSREYEHAILSLGGAIEYKKMWAEGLPWNKCRAINHGVKLADTNYIGTCDVDILFSSDPFSYCLANRKQRTMFHVDTYWLGKDGAFDKAISAGHGNQGGFQIIEKSAFFESGGYDERIVYWGQEDLDWPERLKLLGYSQFWLPEPHKIYHQWHKRSESGFLRPLTATYDTMKYCAENRLKPVLGQVWGKGIEFNDRPILEAMKKSIPAEITFTPNSLDNYGRIVSLIESKQRSGFVKVNFGPRLIIRPFSHMSDFFEYLIKPITALAALDCKPKINSNFEYFYSLLSVFKENGLLDYYLEYDLSCAYLLWS